MDETAGVDPIADIIRTASIAAMARWIEGAVSILRCEVAGHLTPHLTISGDTDMMTIGIASLSSVAADEIVVAELTASELVAHADKVFESRINSLLNRDDLRIVQVRRQEAGAVPAGLSFQDFQKAYRPPALVFACPHCDADAVVVRTDSPTDYRRSGGKLTVMADLEVRG